MGGFKRYAELQRAALLSVWGPKLQHHGRSLVLELLFPVAAMGLIILISFLVLLIRSGSSKAAVTDGKAWNPDLPLPEDSCFFTANGTEVPRWDYCFAVIDDTRQEGVGEQMAQIIAKAFCRGNESMVLHFNSRIEAQQRLLRWTTQNIPKNCTDCIDYHRVGHVVEAYIAEIPSDVDPGEDEEEEEEGQLNNKADLDFDLTQLGGLCPGSGNSLPNGMKPEQIQGLIGWRVLVPSVIDVHEVTDGQVKQPGQLVQKEIDEMRTARNATSGLLVYTHLVAAFLNVPNPIYTKGHYNATLKMCTPDQAAEPLKTSLMSPEPMMGILPSEPVIVHEPVSMTSSNASIYEICADLLIPAFASVVAVSSAASLSNGITRCLLQGGMHWFPAWIAVLTVLVTHLVVILAATLLFYAIRRQTFAEIFGDIYMTWPMGLYLVFVSIFGHLSQAMALSSIFSSRALPLCIMAVITIFAPGASPLVTLQSEQYPHAILSIVAPGALLNTVASSLKIVYMLVQQSFEILGRDERAPPFTLGDLAGGAIGNFPPAHLISPELLAEASPEMLAQARVGPLALLVGELSTVAWFVVAVVALIIRPTELHSPPRWRMLWSAIPNGKALRHHLRRFNFTRPDDAQPVPAKDTGPVVTLQHVKKLYKGRQPELRAMADQGRVVKVGKKLRFAAVNDLSLTLSRRSITGLLGVNGAGKTTLLKCLLGVETPNSGAVSLLGASPSGSPRALLEILPLIGYCPQHNIVGNFSCELHCLIMCSLRGVPGGSRIWKQEALRCLTAVGLVKDGKLYAKGSSLSGGQKRRLQVAMAMCGRPPLLILDEPSAGLSVDAKLDLDDAVRGAAIHSSVVLVEHDLAEVDAIASELVIMRDGRIAAQGTSLTLKQQYGSGYSLRVTLRGDIAGPDLPAYVRRISGVVRQCLGDQAELATRSGRDCFFVLPHSAVESFAGLSRCLEAQGEQLGVVSHAYDLASLDDVFLAIARDTTAPDATPAVMQRLVLSSGGLIRKLPRLDQEELESDDTLAAVSEADQSAGSETVCASLAACSSNDTEAGSTLPTPTPIVPHIMSPAIDLAEAEAEADLMQMSHSATVSDVIDLPHTKVSWGAGTKALIHKSIRVFPRSPPALVHMGLSIGLAVLLCSLLCYLYPGLIIPTVIQNAQPANSSLGRAEATKRFDWARQTWGSGVYYSFSSRYPFSAGEKATIVELMGRVQRFASDKSHNGTNRELSPQQLTAFIEASAGVQPNTGKWEAATQPAVIEWLSPARPRYLLPAEYALNQQVNVPTLHSIFMHHQLQTAAQGFALRPTDQINSMMFNGLLSDKLGGYQSFGADSHSAFQIVAAISPFYGMFLQILVASMTVALPVLMSAERESGLALLFALNDARKGQNLASWLIVLGSIGSVISVVCVMGYCFAPLNLSPFSRPQHTVLYIILSGVGALGSCVSWCALAAWYGAGFRSSHEAARRSPVWQWAGPLLAVVCITVLSMVSLESDLESIARSLQPLMWIFSVLPITHVLIAGTESVFMSLYPTVFQVDVVRTPVCALLQLAWAALLVFLAFKRDQLDYDIAHDMSPVIRWLLTPMRSIRMVRARARTLRQRVRKLRKDSDLTMAEAREQLDDNPHDRHPHADASVDAEAACAAAAPSDSVVVFDRARREYDTSGGKIVALRGLSLVVRRGESLGLVGENGAGKSTALSLAVGCQYPSSGEVRVLSRRVGYVPQTNAHDPRLTVQQHVDLFARLAGMDPADAMRVAVVCGLRDYLGKHPNELSGGYKRRLNLALALITSTELLIADEVAAGVDIDAQASILALMDELKNAGCSLIVTSHSMEAVDRLSTRVAVLVKGRLRTIGTPDEIKRIYSQGIQVTLQTTDDVSADEAALWLSGIAGVDQDSVTILPTLGGDRRFLLPKSAPVTVVDLLQATATSQSPPWVLRAAVSPTTLQSVFLAFEMEAQQIHLTNVEKIEK